MRRIATFIVIICGLLLTSQTNAQLQPKKLPSRVGTQSSSSSTVNDSPSFPPSSSSTADGVSNLQGVQHLANAVGYVTEDVMRGAFEAMKEWGEDRKRFDISATYDAHIEGPSLGVQYRTPIFFGLFARAGYNTHYDEYIYNIKKIRWTAGIQFWFKNWNIVEVGVGESYYKELGDVSYGLFLSTGYCQKIYKGLGVEGSLGGALSFETDGNGDPYFKFVWRVGLVYRFIID